MFSRIKRQTKAYYKAQADLSYVDSLFDNLANSDAPVAFDNDAWMAQAEKAQTKMAAAADEINKLGGTINEGNVYDAQGQHIPCRVLVAA